MSLTGDVNTLALSDLVQVSALNHRTCQIHVIAAHAEGDLFLSRGAVVHAWWGDLVGAEAVYSMLNTPDIGFHVRPDVAIEAHTVAAGWQQLVMEAARRQDHGAVPRPRARTSDRWRVETVQHSRIETIDSTAPDETTAFDHERDRPRLDPLPPLPRRQPPRLLWLIAGGLFAVAAGLFGWRGYTVARRATAGHALAAAVVAPGVIVAGVAEASDLTGPGDALPTLLEGPPPVAPRSEWAVAPTIVCRLVIAADGHVLKSRVYRSRLDLADFEDAALTAVERYRFRPARHAGVPVAVAINWPVAFAAADARATTRLRIKGSDTIGGELAPALARAFHDQHPDVDVAIEALGSKTAFVGLFDGSADLGASSRPVNTDELKQATRLGLSLREFVLAYDGIAVIVHPSNPVASLTLDEVAQIFSGRISDWSALGGPAAPITVINRPSYSGTHTFFRDKVLRRGNAKGPEDFAGSARIVEDNRELVAAVARDANAISFVGHGWLAPSVRALPVGVERDRGVMPNAATIRDGSYPIYRPLLFYARGAPGREAAAFLSFVLSAAGQAIVREHGFVPVDAPAGDAVLAGDPAAAGATVEPLRIGFLASSTRLDAGARARLASLASLVRHAHGARLLVVGHSDADGNRATNHRLALLRAQRVAAQLETLGVAPDGIDVEADAADSPIASNANAGGRRQNRRAEVYILAR
jgi:phosphate transport system substrate-binding protein